MKLSARNQLKGTVVEIQDGAVNGIVKIDLGGGIVISSVITMSSIRELGLKVGGEAYAIIKASNVMVGINLEITRFALNKLKIDKRGLDAIDNKILRTLILTFKGGPVGIGTLATSVSEDAGTLEEVYEPFLIKDD